MADNWTQNVVCRYFQSGNCREGENCRYRHIQDRSESSNSEATILDNSPLPCTIPCRFFKQGVCKFGSRCKFNHGPENEGDSNRANSWEDSSSEHWDSSSNSTTSTKTKEGNTRLAEEWVRAPEFVPSSITSTSFGTPLSNNEECDGGETSGVTINTTVQQMPMSYAQAVNPSVGQTPNLAKEPLCPYAEATGICKKPNCTYLHGDICDLCGRAALHPHNEDLRKKHTNACVKQHEVDMEISFAIQRSRDKTCGVCFEIIMEKSQREQRFGILPNCNHCFCLTCIRKWRQAKQFDNKIIRACPECRVTSDFVCPSMYWVDTKEEKEKLIVDYKDALSTKDCKYFNKGRGKCPFGNKCFYLHCLPDGTKTDVGPPTRQRRNADSDMDFFQQFALWDYINDRDRWYALDDLDDIVALFSDSDDSDWSEYELFIE